MNKTTYFAVTIGPMLPTFLEAKQTRAVWAASYLFSWITKQMLERSQTQGFDIRMPYSQKIYSSEHGSGLYADRIYFAQNDKGDKIKLEKIIQSVLAELGQDIGNEVFTQSYINWHIVEHVGDSQKMPLFELNALLDQKELMQNYVFEISTNPLQQYLANKWSEKSILRKDAFGENRERNFRSITEIATQELLWQNPTKYNQALRKEFKNEDLELILALKENNFDIKPRHKYYAVIYADGDNIGALLTKAQDNPEHLKGFSQSLLDFGLLAEQSIAEYGGNGIYLGGEDILVFAPIACENQKHELKTIFDLVRKLDEDFAKTVIEFAKKIEVDSPSMSYGIMLSYIKHPLKEAMNYALHNLLDKKAKSGSKNKIAICFQKHSGQRIECVIDKHKDKRQSYDAIEDLLKQYIAIMQNKSANSEKEKKQSKDFLAGVMHRFNDDLFFDLYSIAVDKNRLDAFFENFFNEDVHKGNAFLTSIQAFSKAVFEDYMENEVDENSRKNLIFTILRYIHFINSERE